ncbi:hypothetical protein SVA_0782 [Sulfurifustis variabilis]|uniref:Uncharacterized protein n=1 Tax=Sulfurifustis variabilis TaxID=1675686 RepID=A0A1B4VAY1_9GAMM|nr:hypothetical protein SVA_0782 [Sulfurifustis variabilis]
MLGELNGDSPQTTSALKRKCCCSGVPVWRARTERSERREPEGRPAGMPVGRQPAHGRGGEVANVRWTFAPPSGRTGKCALGFCAKQGLRSPKAPSGDLLARGSEGRGVSAAGGSANGRTGRCALGFAAERDA